MINPLLADDTDTASLAVSKDGTRFGMAQLPAGSGRRVNEDFDEFVSKLGKRPCIREAYKIAVPLLSGAGYTEMGWFPLLANDERIGLVPLKEVQGKGIKGVGGFTKVEQFSDDGSPKGENIRWSKELPPSGFSSFTDFIQTLLHGAKSGKYRAFFVAITEKHVVQKQLKPHALEDIGTMRVAGLRAAPLEWLSDDLTRIHLLVVVYEFEKSAVDGSVVFIKDSNRSIDFHLKGSKLDQFFGP